jgi:hypothetical protein
MRFTTATSFLSFNLKNNDYNRNGKMDTLYLFYRAVEQGKADTVLDFINQEIVKCDSQALYLAALNGNLEVVKILCENGTEITDDIVEVAREKYYVNILKYLYNRNLEMQSTNAEERNPPNTQDCW